jgi:RimJ/RimL family protein N-acetyltransferase
MTAPSIELRDVAEDDLQTLFEHQSDPVAAEMAAFPSREREPFMTHWKNVLADEGVVKKAVWLDGQLVGSVVSFDRSSVREVGYWLDRAYWGRGIATGALRSFLKFEPRRPLYGRVAVNNPASVRVLEKCGFVLADDGRTRIAEDGVEEFTLRLA